MVVVGVSAHDREHVTPGDRLEDARRIVGGVDHDDVGVVADEPHVVVDLEVLTVETEDPARDDAVDAGAHAPNTTTLRSTFPWCILSNAASTSPMPMVSETKSCKGSRPWR